MRWTVETLDAVDEEIKALPPKLQARLLRLLEMVENVGLEQIHEPHVKHLAGKLWELRAKAQEGIARGIYVTGDGAPCGGTARLRQEVAKDPKASVGAGAGTDETGGNMSKLADLKARLMENPEVREEYAQADAEFSLIEDMIRARTDAKLPQAQLAERIGTTQSAIARLEGGKVSPSIATLRRYAEATGHQLRVGFE